MLLSQRARSALFVPVGSEMQINRDFTLNPMISRVAEGDIMKIALPDIWKGDLILWR